MLARRSRVRTFLVSALVVVSVLGLPVTASADSTESRQCSGHGGMAYGWITRHIAQTHTVGNCGSRIKVRVYYSHMGGTSWTSWKTVTPGSNANVRISVYPNNAIYAEHYADGAGTFITQFN
ncbi:hypothetical protein HNR06_004923 [Nocardiopsis arvandica]|jgi:hypothetical protein|uniref:Secreted protein n=1 Tax=Nocardiopsis sinuspersici TaxID=501010 RepID=A0A7Y9XGI7_9ACTN|nr:hypothetical protein [Nocardiopsis sinuspersici]